MEIAWVFVVLTMIFSVRMLHSTVVVIVTYHKFLDEIAVAGTLRNRGDQLKRLQEIDNAKIRLLADSGAYIFDLTRWRPEACLPEVYAMLKKP